MKWQGALAQTDRIVANRGISVARCYPMKNRSPDVLPYDWSRVELPSTKDDYINASLLEVYLFIFYFLFYIDREIDI